VYTQCPECQVAFRITAQVLQKARGRVRCGGCGSAFSAIDHLSEQLPGSASNPSPDAEQARGTNGTPDDDADKSKALLASLAGLAGDEQVRIEDTGIEWRVLDNDDVAEDQQDPGVKIAQPPSDDAASVGNRESGAQESLDLQSAPADRLPHAERRYDDNTPLPDDFDDDEDLAYRQSQIALQRRAGDQKQIETEFDSQQIDLDIGDEEGWAELLDDEQVSAEVEIDLSDELAAAEAQQIADDSALLPELAAEVAEDLTQGNGAAAAAISMGVEEELAAIHSELTQGAAAASGGTQASLPADIDTQFNTQAEAMGLDITRNEELKTDNDRAGLPGPDRDENSNEPALEEQSIGEAGKLADTSIAELELELDGTEGDEADDTSIAVIGDDGDAPTNEDDVRSPNQDGNERPDEDDTAFAGLDDDGDAPTSEDDLQPPDQDGNVLPDEDEVAPSDEDDVAASDEDDLSPLEEASIVDKLRESTGEFQKQIEAAQRALESGDIDSNDESAEIAVDETPEKADEDELADLTPPSGAEDLPGDDEAAGSDDESLRESDAREKLSQTMIQAGIDPSALDSDNVETIVMEGDFVRGSLFKEQPTEESEPITRFDDPEFLADTYMLNKGKVRGGRRKSDPAGIGIIAGIIVLSLVLVAQYMHASRDSLATYGAFNQTIGPVYRALGKPVTPEWDVKGWQFETTNGSTDENQQLLTIFSRIRNASDQALPYPLVHVSLTDRWEEIIGSKVLEPGEYLAGDLDPRKAVAPGDKFTAVIAVESPSVDATGFKLNVCYRVSPGRVRCATEDFKE